MDILAIALAVALGFVAGFFIGRSTAPKPRTGINPGNKPGGNNPLP